MTREAYPGMVDRIKAVMLDGFMLIVFMFAFSALFETIGEVPDSARIWAFLFVFVLYDPIFTSAFGGTLGHMANGLRVKRASDPSKNVFFPLALLRYVVKAFFGLDFVAHGKRRSQRQSLARHVGGFRGGIQKPTPGSRSGK